ncbi:hypothetical protein OGM63_23495 [Plectonema radiosum NIES-515]|uniref:Transposase n=2 Tax=Plectonema TaxID=1183 RepID=A0ABT3B4Y2_9CYAN|nr:hypothetical protein [Plectonema radiosum NIES-515]
MPEIYIVYLTPVSIHCNCSQCDRTWSGLRIIKRERLIAVLYRHQLFYQPRGEINEALKRLQAMVRKNSLFLSLVCNGAFI